MPPKDVGCDREPKVTACIQCVENTSLLFRFVHRFSPVRRNTFYWKQERHYPPRLVLVNLSWFLVRVKFDNSNFSCHYNLDEYNGPKYVESNFFTRTSANISWLRFTGNGATSVAFFKRNGRYKCQWLFDSDGEDADNGYIYIVEILTEVSDNEDIDDDIIDDEEPDVPELVEIIVQHEGMNLM